MARSARFLLPGYPVHVIQRGHNRATCFHDEQGHDLYLGLLQEYARSQGCAVHAYVLMTNHFHLLLTPAEKESVSHLMRKVNQRYSQFVNRKLQRCGSLWQGRFKASIVDSEEYFFTCQRYIELNPVRAGMVDGPAAYPWSSFRANAVGFPSALITPHARYLALGRDAVRRQAAYGALFDEPLSAEDIGLVRSTASRGAPLGRAPFAAEVIARLKEQDQGRS